MAFKQSLAGALGLAVLGASLTLPLAGCGTPPPAVGDDHVSEYPNVEAAGGLNKFMRVNNVAVNQQNSILFAAVDVRWIGKNPVYYEYRFIFFDSRGRPINPDGPWSRGDSEPGSVDYLTANATQPDATDWRLQIRPRS
ncbi:MAG: DUF1425 domain-containing protein [Planctomycetota bacterium]